MSDSAPDITLLICTRNRAGSLEKTLASVAAAAAYGDDTVVEVVIVDNGSSDDTPAITAAWAAAQPFAVIVLREDRPGLATARNTGIAHARGGIIAVTDDDCRLHNDYFRALGRAFAETGGAAVIGGRVLPGDPADLPVTVKLEGHPMVAPPGDFPGGFVMGANLAFNRAAFARIGRFDDRFGAGAAFVAAEDTDFLLRATRQGIPVSYDHRIVVDHHHGRRCRRQATMLLAGYSFGDGALYAKHLLGDWRIGRAILSDVAALWLDLAAPVRAHPGIRFFYAFRLRHKLLGFCYYCGRAAYTRLLAPRGLYAGGNSPPSLHNT